MGWGFEWFLHEFQRGSEIRIGSNRLNLLRFSNGLKNYDFQVGWRFRSFESSQKIKGSNGLNLLRFSFCLWGSNGLSVWTESELLRIAYAFGFGFSWLIEFFFFFDKSVFFFYEEIVCLFFLSRGLLGIFWGKLSFIRNSVNY